MDTLSSAYFLYQSIEGFTWWLAVVTHIAYQHVGPTRTTDDGVKLTAGHWYMNIMYYDRYPVQSETDFRLNKDSEATIDVEGVIFTAPMRLVPVRSIRTRSSRATPTNRTQHAVVKLLDHDTLIPQIEAALKELSL